MSGTMKRLAPWLVVALAVAGLDRWSKVVVMDALRPGESIVLTPFFNLVLWLNSGAAFSFLAGGGASSRLLLIGIAVAATVLIVWLLASGRREPLFCAGLAMILGGALGNLWDRVETGHVVDFLLFHAGGYYWPAFNLADSAITVGAGLVIFDGLRAGKRAKRAQAHSGQA
jgi:signal peptidase II